MVGDSVGAGCDVVVGDEVVGDPVGAEVVGDSVGAVCDEVGDEVVGEPVGDDVVGDSVGMSVGHVSGRVTYQMHSSPQVDCCWCTCVEAVHGSSHQHTALWGRKTQRRRLHQKAHTMTQRIHLHP